MFWKLSTILAAAVLGGWLGNMFQDREPPVRILHGSVETKEVKPGGLLRIRYELERFRVCPMKTERIVIDSHQTRFVLEPLEISAAGDIGRFQYSVLISLPREMLPGPATYQATVSYFCNPLSRIFPVIVTGREYAFVVGQ